MSADPVAAPVSKSWAFTTPTLTMSNLITFLGTLMATYYAMHPARPSVPASATSPAAAAVAPATLPALPLYPHVAFDAEDPVAKAYPTYAAHSGYPALIVTDAANRVIYADSLPETRAEIVAVMKRLRGR